jgi:hypothetical protein
VLSVLNSEKLSTQWPQRITEGHRATEPQPNRRLA